MSILIVGVIYIEMKVLGILLHLKDLFVLQLTERRQHLF